MVTVTGSRVHIPFGVIDQVAHGWGSAPGPTRPSEALEGHKAHILGKPSEASHGGDDDDNGLFVCLRACLFVIFVCYFCLLFVCLLVCVFVPT